MRGSLPLPCVVRCPFHAWSVAPSMRAFLPILCVTHCPYWFFLWLFLLQYPCDSLLIRPPCDSLCSVCCRSCVSSVALSVRRPLPLPCVVRCPYHAWFVAPIMRGPLPLPCVLLCIFFQIRCPSKNKINGVAIIFFRSTRRARPKSTAGVIRSEEPVKEKKTHRIVQGQRGRNALWAARRTGGPPGARCPLVVPIGGIVSGR